MNQNSQRRRLTREESKEATRRALLDAAAQVFARHGFHGASIDMVAESAGYTKGAVYAHFKTKDDLYLALLDEHLSTEPTGFVEQIEAGVPIQELVARIEHELPAEIERHRQWAMLTLEFMLYALRDETVRPRLAERLRRVTNDYQKSLRRRFAAGGRSPSIPVEQLPAALMAFENGFSLFALIDSEVTTPAVYAAVVEHLLDR